MENSYAEGIAVGVEKAIGIAILRGSSMPTANFVGYLARGLRRRHRHLAVSVDAGRRRIAPFP
jgi:hypothetical protein